MSQKVPLIVKGLRVYFNSVGLLFPKHSGKYLQKLFSTPRARVLKKHEIEVLKKAKKSFLKVDGSRLKIYEWGQGNQIAMLFHGWETNAGSLGAFVEPLVRMGYKVVAYDAPAHGGSEGKLANLVYFKSSAKAVIKEKGIPEVVIGHSLGADSIIMTAFEEDIKFEKVILIAPLNRLMSVFEQMQELLKIPEKLFVPFIEYFEKLTTYPFKNFYFHNYGRKTALENVLLFHDKNDRITNFSHAKDFKNNWPAVHLETIEGSGHYKILWDDKVLNESLNYIKK